MKRIAPYLLLVGLVASTAPLFAAGEIFAAAMFASSYKPVA